MVGTYLVCDLCGNFGPPASFITRDGIRLCYQCAYHEDNPIQEGKEIEKQDNNAERVDAPKSTTVNK